MELRIRKRVLVHGDFYWMYELTVSDVFTLCRSFKMPADKDIIGSLFSDLFHNQSLLQSITDCPRKLLLNLSVSEFKNLQESFLELNSKFFRKKLPESKTATNSEDFVGDLFLLYCNLIETGHVDVLNYGYSFFFKAINNQEKLKSRRIAEIANAVRTAQHADNKQWKRYMRGLTG